MIYSDFIKLYEELNTLNEAAKYKNGYIEKGRPIDLSSARMIESDVVDIRGEFEESACLYYNDVLTRVAAWVLIFRDGPEGKEVLMRLWRSAFYLPGGGVDLHKDGTNPVKTIEREVWEEFNYKITNIKSTDCNYWEYSEKPWVVKHVANEEDRWNGYYTLLYTAEFEGLGDNDMPEEFRNYPWQKVSDILARPDTQKLKFVKEAIIQNGYSK